MCLIPWAVSLIFPSWRIMNFPSECSGRIFQSVSCPAGSSPPDGGMKRDSRHSPCGRCIVCDAFTVRVWPLRKLPEDTKISDKEKTTGYHLVSCRFYRKATIGRYNAQCDHGIHWSVQRGKTEGGKCYDFDLCHYLFQFRNFLGVGNHDQLVAFLQRCMRINIHTD